MAAKFGKREKIVVGVIAGIVAIAGVHFFIFQQPTQQLQLLIMQKDSLAMQAQGIPQVPGDQVIQEFDLKTLEEEKLLFRALLDMDLLPSPIFSKMMVPPPVPPPPAPEDQRAMLQELWRLYTIRLEAYQRASEDLVAGRVERLIQMKRAYEAGQSWPGDSVGVENPQPITRPMKLSFIEGKTADPLQDGWRIPLALPAPLRERPRLWDQVSHLYDAWDPLTLIIKTNPNYWPSMQVYLYNLEQIGLPNLQTLRHVQNQMGKDLPAVICMMMARLIWSQVPEDGPVPTVGLNRPLSLDRLREMFSFEAPALPGLEHLAIASTRMPDYNQLRTLYSQLSMLESLLIVARRDGVEDVLMVRLFSPGTIVEKVVATPGAPPPPPMPGDDDGYYDDDAAFYSLRPLEPLVQEIPKAYAALLTIRFRATSQNAFRFLSDVATLPAYYRIEDIWIVTERDKVVVQVTLQGFLDILGVGGVYAGLVDYVTGEPKPQVFPDQNVGKTLYEQKLEEQKKGGFDQEKIIAEAFAKVGYNPAPTPPPGPAPAAPAPSADPAAP